MITESMLTTNDNPFDPFDDYDNWLAFDINNGYNTSAYLARITITSNELSEQDQLIAIDNAIDEIISENVSGNYKKISRLIQI
jgi:hypothetical protein